MRRVNAVIAELPAKLREALVLRAVEGMSQAEAAEALGVTEKTVETRLYRARAELKHRIAGTNLGGNLQRETADGPASEIDRP